jgi:hypothetical protein
MIRLSTPRSHFLALVGIALSITACSSKSEPTPPPVVLPATSIDITVEPTEELALFEMKSELEVPVPSYDPVAWKLEHGLIPGPAQRSLVDAPGHAVGSVDSFSVRDDSTEAGITEMSAELL